MKLQVEPVIVDAKKGIKEYHQTLIEATIAASIMVVAWITLGILNYLGVDNKFLYPLNFLTASLNGMQGGGILGVIGGILAKLTLLTMIVQIVIPMYKEAVIKKEHQSIKDNVNRYKELFAFVFGQGVKLAGFAIIGIGLALLVYAFLTVNGNFENSFVIVLALITTLRILFSQTSAVIRFFTTLFRLTPVNNAPVYSVFIGLSIGFTISVSMAVLFSSAYLAYLFGIIVVTTGYLLISIEKRKMERTVA